LSSKKISGKKLKKGTFSVYYVRNNSVRNGGKSKTGSQKDRRTDDKQRCNGWSSIINPKKGDLGVAARLRFHYSSALTKKPPQMYHSSRFF